MGIWKKMTVNEVWSCKEGISSQKICRRTCSNAFSVCQKGQAVDYPTEPLLVSAITPRKS